MRRWLARLAARWCETCAAGRRVGAMSDDAYFEGLREEFRRHHDEDRWQAQLAETRRVREARRAG